MCGRFLYPERGQKTTFFDPLPPHLVYVVIEWPLTVCGSSDQLVISNDQKIFEDIGNRKQERGIDEGRGYKQNLRYNHAYGC